MLPHLKYFVAAVTTIGLLTSCAGGASTPTAPNTRQPNQSQVLKHATSSCPCLYVANVGSSEGSKPTPDRITVYAAGATGNTPPIQDIAGSKTGLNSPYGIAVDARSDMYAVNASGSSVTVYATGSTGNVKPIQTISGSNTGLYSPSGIALDPVNGDIYVTNYNYCPSCAGSVESWASGSNGNVAPIE